MFFCDSLHDADELMLVSTKNESASIDVANSLWDALSFEVMPSFPNDGELMEFNYATDVLKSVVIYYVEHVTNNGTFRLCGKTEANDVVVVCYTENIEIVHDLLQLYMTRNVQMNGILTQLWGGVTCDDVLHAVRGREGVTRIRTQGNGRETAEEIIFQSFEEERERVLSEKYDEHHKYKIEVDNTANIAETKDNEECIICYEHADCVCSVCGASICIRCVDKLSKSTATCPNCQTAPFKLKNIANRPLFISTGTEVYA